MKNSGKGITSFAFFQGPGEMNGEELNLKRVALGAHEGKGQTDTGKHVGIPFSEVAALGAE